MRKFISSVISLFFLSTPIELFFTLLILLLVPISFAIISFSSISQLIFCVYNLSLILVIDYIKRLNLR